MAGSFRPTIPPLSGSDMFGEVVARWALPFVLAGMAGLAACAVICLYVVRFAVIVNAAGVLEPGSTRNVYSPETGLVGAVRIRPGDWVAQGDVLAILVTFPRTNEVEAVQTRLEIKSPSAGTVVTEHVSDLVGRSISRGELVCEVGIVTDWNVDAFSVAGSLQRVSVGDAVMVTVPALAASGAPADAGFPGRVVSIRSESSASGPDAAVRDRLRVRLDSAGIDPAKLRGLRRGVAATLRITTRPARAIDLVSDYLRERTVLDSRPSP